MSHNNVTIQGIEPLANANVPLTLASVVSPSGSGTLGYNGTTWDVVTYTPAVSLDWARAVDVFTEADSGTFSTSTAYYNTTDKWSWMWRYITSTNLLGSSVTLQSAVAPPATSTNTLWGMAAVLPAGSYVVKWAITTDERTGTGDADLRLWLATSSEGTSGEYVGNALRLFAGERHGGHLVASFTTTSTRYLFARITATNGYFALMQSYIFQRCCYINIRSFS